jgi:hypothetical protein
MLMCKTGPLTPAMFENDMPFAPHAADKHYSPAYLAARDKRLDVRAKVLAFPRVRHV